MINYKLIVQSPLLLFIEYIGIALLAVNLPLIPAFIISSLFYLWIASCCILIQKLSSTTNRMPFGIYVFFIAFIISFGPLYSYAYMENNEGLMALLSWIYLAIAIFLYIWFSYLLVHTEQSKGLNKFGKFLTIMQIIFFPIGIWWLQPRIEKVLGAVLTNQN